MIVVWQAESGGGIGERTTYRVFDSSGPAVGNQVQIGAPNSYHGDAAALAENWVVVWPNTTDFNVYAAFIGPDGQQLGDKIQVNSDPTGDSYELNAPSVAALANGGFVVTWMYWDVYGNFFQLFDGDGNKVGEQSQLSPQGRWTDVSAWADGFAAAWTHKTSEQEVHCRLFDNDGTAASDEVAIVSAKYPAIASIDSDHLVVTWRSTGANAVWHQLLDGAANKLGAEVQTDAGLGFTINRPDVAALGSGKYAIVWGASYLVNLRLWSSEGPLGDEEMAANVYVDGWSKKGAPRIAVRPDGGWNIVWKGENQPPGQSKNIFAQRFDADGNKLYH